MKRWKQNRVRVRLETAANDGVRAVFQELEQRRLLSFDGGIAPDAGDTGPVDDPGIDEVVTLDAGEESPIRTLGGIADDDAEGADGSGEWVYLTMAGEGEGEALPDERV